MQNQNTESPDRPRDLPIADEQFCDLAGGMRLCYRVRGNGPPILLIAGLQLQLHSWPVAMADGLVERGFSVITFDNRDVGRSSRIGIAPSSKLQLLLRRARTQDYDLTAMAADAAGLLEYLRLGPAHVVGMSMGGMIAQTLAATRPDLVRSLTSIFSTTGARRVGQPALASLLRLLQGPPRTREAAVQRFVDSMRAIGGRDFPIDAAALADYAGKAWDRGGPDRDAGVVRQITAIVKSGDRTAMLRRITAPTLVVHGDRDPMVHPSGGRATAAAIPDARLVVIPGMGHDIAPGVVPRLLNLICDNAARPPSAAAGSGSPGPTR